MKVRLRINSAGAIARYFTPGQATRAVRAVLAAVPPTGMKASPPRHFPPDYLFEVNPVGCVAVRWEPV